MKNINRMTKILVMTFLVVSMFATVGAAPLQSGTSLFVDGANGSDSNSGLSISSPVRTIQKAVSIAQPGNTIYVRGGTYNENIVISRSGTDGAPITLTPYSGEAVVINGNGATAIRTSGAVVYWVLDGLTIRSTARYTMQLGWWGEPMTDHWIVRNNTIFGANFIMGSYHLWEDNNIDGTGYPGTSGDAGISDGGDSHHNIYRGNYVHDFTNVDARGIWTQGKTHDSIIEYNIVHNINTASGLGQCIDLDGAAQVEWRHTVRGNKVSNCSYVGIQLENVFDSVIENNVIVGGTAGIIVINYDASFGCKVGGEYDQYGDTDGDGDCQGDITNNIIRQNLITTPTNWGWGYGGIVNWFAGGLNIWGNTIFSNGAAGNGGVNFQGTLDQTKGGSLKGNIITQGNGAAICARDLAAFSEDDFNLVYRTNNSDTYAQGGGCETGYSLTEYQAMTGNALNSLSANPIFTNPGGGDFHLTSASPAIDSGVNVDAAYDIEGSVRPINVTYDIGVYEFGGVPAPATPTATSLPTGVITATLNPTATGLASSTPPPTLTPINQPTQASGNNLAIGKPAMQSSVYEGASASRAVDGNTDGNFANNSVTHTNVDAQAWWQVDLGVVTQIQTVNVWTRTDCCEWRSNDVYVLVSDSPFISTNLDSTRNQPGVSSTLISGLVGSPSTVNVNQSGRYIRVQLTGTDNLSLAEVEVFGAAGATVLPTNSPSPTLTPINIPTATSVPNTPTPTVVPTLVPTLAPSPTQIINTLVPTSVPTLVPSLPVNGNLAQGKPATQSSTYGGAIAARATDGNTDGNYANKSVTHTKENSQAWWQVDLGSPSQIDSINVWARSDCCEWRSNNVYVLVSDNPFVSTDLLAAINQTGVSSYNIAGNVARPSAIAINRSGRYVRVQLTGRDFLSLAEVEVFGAAAVIVPTNTPQPVITLPPTAMPTLEPTNPPTVLPTMAPTMIETQATISNLAIGKAPTQSSDYEGAVAARAVDGNTDGNFANNSVTHTKEDLYAWWSVDLTASNPVEYINLWARTDCCEWRTNNVYVLVSDNPILSFDLETAKNQAGVSSYLVSGLVGRPSRVDVLRTGRYIRVHLSGRDSLSLAEVEVMGGPGVVLPALSQQSSVPEPEATPTLFPTILPTNTELPLPTSTAFPTPTLTLIVQTVSFTATPTMTE